MFVSGRRHRPGASREARGSDARNRPARGARGVPSLASRSHQPRRGRLSSQGHAGERPDSAARRSRQLSGVIVTCYTWLERHATSASAGRCSRASPERCGRNEPPSLSLGVLEKRTVAKPGAVEGSQGLIPASRAPRAISVPRGAFIATGRSTLEREEPSYCQVSEPSRPPRGDLGDDVSRGVGVPAYAPSAFG